MSGKTNGENVKVMVRTRPMNKSEFDKGIFFKLTF